MADVPRQQLPYNNMNPVVSFDWGDAERPTVVPPGKRLGKVSQAQAAIQGLIGAR